MCKKLVNSSSSKARIIGHQGCANGTKNALFERILPMDFFFGHTETMRELQSKVGLIARSYLPMLIEGETGTGKERLARTCMNFVRQEDGWSSSYATSPLQHSWRDLTTACRRPGGCGKRARLHYC